MPNANHVFFMGHAVREPVLKYLPNNTACLESAICVNNRKKQGTEWVSEPCFMDFVCFGRTAEIANAQMSKGCPLAIDGRMRQETWDDKKTGQKRSKLVIVVEQIIIGFKAEPGEGDSPNYQRAGQQRTLGGAHESPRPSGAGAGTASGGDDIPFAFLLAAILIPFLNTAI